MHARRHKTDHFEQGRAESLTFDIAMQHTSLPSVTGEQRFRRLSHELPDLILAEVGPAAQVNADTTAELESKRVEGRALLLRALGLDGGSEVTARSKLHKDQDALAVLVDDAVVVPTIHQDPFVQFVQTQGDYPTARRAWS
jgi:hypothetical protein